MEKMLKKTISLMCLSVFCVMMVACSNSLSTKTTMGDSEANHAKPLVTTPSLSYADNTIKETTTSAPILENSPIVSTNEPIIDIDKLDKAEDFLESEVPEFEQYAHWISEKSNGKANFFLMPYPLSYQESLNGYYYSIYVGESWPNYNVNWDWFWVSEDLKEIYHEDIVSGEMLTLDEWRRSPEYRSFIDESPTQPTDAMTAAAKIYYDYLIAQGEIETESASVADGNTVCWNVNELYYYVDDFNNDSIPDLAISAEQKDSNGIEIITLKDGQVEKLLSKGMPYSAGSEMFTLATYEGMYGVLYLRYNSMGDFYFSKIHEDGTMETMFDGVLYDIDGNAQDTSNTYDKLKPITFYPLEELYVQ